MAYSSRPQNPVDARTAVAPGGVRATTSRNASCREARRAGRSDAARGATARARRRPCAAQAVRGFEPYGATLPFCISRHKAGRFHPCAQSRDRAPGRCASGRVGNSSQGISMRLEQRGRDRAHQRVLRLIRDARLSPPGDDQQLRQPKGPGERGQRAHGIAQPGILHHGDAAPERALAVARERDAGDRAPPHRLHWPSTRMQRGVLQHVVDERRQKRAGHAGVPAKSPLARRLDELMRFNHARRGAAPGSAPSCD